MTTSVETPIQNPNRFFIGGKWVEPSSNAAIDVIDSNDGTLYYSISEANTGDVDRAVAAARDAFDNGPWPRMTPAQRGEFLRAFAEELRRRAPVLADIWPRESGSLFSMSKGLGEVGGSLVDGYADLAESFPWEEQHAPTAGGEFGLVVREAVGVVAAIIPWNGPLRIALHKCTPALLAGCTVILKSSPEAPGMAYVLAEVAEAIGLPPGVLNVITADREASEALVRDPRVDKVSFTGSTATGRRIASIMGERIGRYSLELGGKSPAIILDDADLDHAAATLAAAECMLSGQVCASLTRIIVTQRRHDEFAELLGGYFSQKRVGNAFDADSDMGPLASAVQRDRVEGHIAKGLAEGGTLVTGGGRPKDLDRGFFIEPTVFANIDNSASIAQNEIFGPVLVTIPARDEADAIRIANDTIYGLNASVFTEDADRAREVAGQIRSGTVGHNALRVDFGLGFGGYKQSGIGREGGLQGQHAFVETKTIVLDGTPSRYRK